MSKIAFIFPGQGDQYPKMGRDFFDNFSLAKEVFEAANDFLGKDMTKIIFEGSEEDLTKTINSQLCVFITSQAILAVIKKEFSNLTPFVCAGLSLGEYSALCSSGKITYKDALLLIDKRAKYMNEACEKHKGTMSAVIGLNSDAVEKVVLELKKSYPIWAANFNTPLQTVISGTVAGVEATSKALIEAGAKKIIPLQVFGAFHSGLMQEAQDKLVNDIDEISLIDTPINIVMNATGNFASFHEIKKNLIIQVTSSVRWCQSIQTMDKSGVDTYLEIGPGKTLSGMNKRIGPKGATFNVEFVSDLEKLSKVLA
jgi:[acyl-carrier-protein] S-malonyltransferase